MNLNTAKILVYLGFSWFTDFEVREHQGVRTLEWYSESPQPTEVEIDATELTPEYTQWAEQHGGDPLKTLRRLAKEALSGNHAEHALLRSALLVIVDEFNRHSQTMNSLLDAIDSASNLATLKAAVGAISNLPDRTGAQLRMAAIKRLDDGDADS